LFIERFVLVYSGLVEVLDLAKKGVRKKIKINFADSKKVFTFAIPNGTDHTRFGSEKENERARGSLESEKQMLRIA
jgi:hypothetical protein